MNKKENMGFQKTHQRIQETLMAMIEKKPIQSITVSDLCKAVDINRSTFYAHFTDIYAVMESICEKLENELIEEYKANYVLGTDMLSNDYMIVFLTHIEQNQGFYKAYMSESNMNILQQSMALLKAEVMQPIFKRMDVSDRIGDYYFNFFSAGIVTILRQWLYDGCPESPGELAEIINSILPQAPEKLLVYQEPQL